MINRILMELYDDYEKSNIQSLIDFANITFPKYGTQKLFIGCCIILFTRARNNFKPRYKVTREDLFEIVLAAKEKVDNNNLLEFYLDRINREKIVYKYLENVVKDKEIDKFADVILSYLDQFKPSDFVKEIKSYEKSLDKYIKKNRIKKEEIVE